MSASMPGRWNGVWGRACCIALGVRLRHWYRDRL